MVLSEFGSKYLLNFWSKKSHTGCSEVDHLSLGGGGGGGDELEDLARTRTFFNRLINEADVFLKWKKRCMI